MSAAAPLIRLVCWKPEVAAERAESLMAAGFEVNAEPMTVTKFVAHFKRVNPGVLLIDLDRQPSHGHMIAKALRLHPSICHIPIVFAGGLPEKVAKVRAELPDATFTEWPKVAAAIKRAIRTAPLVPVKPEPYMKKFEGTPLTKKLGFKAELKVALLGAPEGFEESLGDLPEGLVFQTRMTAATGLAMWFIRSARELEGETEFLAARLPQGVSIWFVYPKAAGRIRADFNQNDVRAVGLAHGLVDYKICAVDADWTGLKFARKKGK
ncbi:MAG: hypothetical protein ABI972_06705 [Acidobacteriota bacterium]